MNVSVENILVDWGKRKRVELEQNFSYSESQKLIWNKLQAELYTVNSEPSFAEATEGKQVQVSHRFGFIWKLLVPATVGALSFILVVENSGLDVKTVTPQPVVVNTTINPVINQPVVDNGVKSLDQVQVSQAEGSVNLGTKTNYSVGGRKIFAQRTQSVFTPWGSSVYTPGQEKDKFADSVFSQSSSY